jgi:predicted permease
VNVASLLLARGTARSREVAIRTALGGGRARLAGQFLVEGAVYATVAGAIGLGIAALGIRLLRAAAPGDLPAVHRVGIDLRVLGVTLAVSAFVAVVFGLVPALQADGRNLGERLQGASDRGGTASAGKRRLRAALVVAELALAVTIATGAGLLVRSFGALTSVDTGFRPAGVVKAEVQLPAGRYPRDFSVWPVWPEILGFEQRLLTELSNAPGVESVALAGPHPLAPGFTNSFQIEGRDASAPPLPEISVRPVSTGYLETAGVPLVRGRTLGDEARPDGPGLALVNQAAASAFFEGDAVGRRLTFWGVTREIVGVVANERFRGLDQDAPPAVYVSTRQVPQWNLSVLVRGDDPDALARTVRSAISGVDPALAVFGVEPLDETLSGSLARRRFPMILMTLLASLALVLALIGVHGVLSYTVEQRRREMGIRLALGARPGDLLRLVLGEGLRLASLGLALGLFGAWAATRLLAALLYGVQPMDPVTFVSVGALVVTAAAVATVAPALRAARVDPARTLQAQ